MKKQIIVIHGGATFNSHQEYIHFLKQGEVSANTFKTKRSWKDFLQKELGEEFEVFTPQMPNKYNASYEDWKIWFERIIPFINDNVILIGHSLGGIFLAKYLSKNIFAKKISAVLLVAAPFDDKDLQETLGDFILPLSLEKFYNQTKKIYLFFSNDDPVVPFEQMSKYKNVLLNAQMFTFTDRQHFNQESFPEILELLKNIQF